MKTRGFNRRRGWGIAHIGLAVAVGAGFSAAAMLLWNTLIPDIFGLTTISFWQALGLMVLVRIFFAGIGGHQMGGGWRRHMDGHHFRDKWQKMSAEERREFVKKHRVEFENKRGNFGRGRDFFDREIFDAETNGNTPKGDE